MVNRNSDISVNIKVEEVIKLLDFGGICIYEPCVDNIKMPYSEAYSIDDVEEILTDAEITNGTILKMAKTIFIQENRPQKIGLLSCPISDLEKYIACDFRYLIIATSKIADVKAVAEYIESCGDCKVLCVDLLKGESGNFVKYSDYKAEHKFFKDYERTVFYLGVPIIDGLNSISSALFSETSNKQAGSFTYKNQKLKGVYADEAILEKELNEIHNYNVNAYVNKAGYSVTSEGKCANGEYIDILDSKDWIITQIKYRLQQALIINDKIPYDNTGIALLESIVVNILQDAYNNGMIANDESGKPSYSVNFAKRSETDASDRAKRQYLGGKFSFDLSGAVHTVTVNGVINI